MKHKNLITRIKENTPLDVNDLVRRQFDGNCFIITNENDDSYDLINIYDDSKDTIKKEVIRDGKHEKVYISKAIMEILSTHKPLSAINNPQYALNKIVDDYALQICINILGQIIANNSVVDYPKVIVAANTTPTTHISIDTNGDWHKSSWNNLLLKRINDKKLSLGAIGITSKNTIGNCAEQHTANNLATLYTDTDLDKIVFSKAIRPRTGEIRDYCDNCLTLFHNQLKN